MSEQAEAPGPGSPTDAGDVDQDSEPPSASQSSDPGVAEGSESPPSEEKAHSRPGQEDLPFGSDPQENQGDDPASGGA